MSYNIKNLSLEEIKEKIEPEDLQMMVTLGITISGRYDELFSLKEFLIKDSRYKVIYKSISSTHLRVVKINEFEEFEKWKKSKQ